LASRAVRLAPDIDAAASRHDIDPLLLHAIAHVESRHNPEAVSPAGALGLMQVMPATARRFGVNRAPALHDAKTNLEVSARYLKSLQQRFGNDLPLVLAAYNAGEGRVERCGPCVPPVAETRAYVHDVLRQYDRLKAAAASGPGESGGHR
jgi:lysozyme